MVKQLLEQRYFHNSVATWGITLAAVVVTVGALMVLKSVVLARLRQRAEDHPGVFRQVAVDAASHTTTLFQVAMGAAAASYFLEMPEAWSQRIHTCVALAVILQAGLWGQRFVRFALVAIFDSRGDPQDAMHRSGRTMLRFMGSVVVWSAVVLLGLENLGINVSALVTGLGVTGVAVALATQNLVSDLFASISILLDKPFLVGDFIIADAYMGTVERIGVRTTRLRSISGEEIILANGDLSKSRVRNFRTMQERRVVFNFSLRYETPMETLMRVPDMVRDAVEAADNTRFDRAEMLTFGDSGLSYEVAYYVLDANYNLYTKRQQEINYGIMRRFAAEDIQFAYRTTVVYNVEAAESRKKLAA